MIIMENLPIKVRFLKQFTKHSFVQVGMIADLQKIEYDVVNHSYKLFFDFKKYILENKSLFEKYCNAMVDSGLYTEQESVKYMARNSGSHYYTTYFDVVDDFNSEILEYLEVVL